MGCGAWSCLVEFVFDFIVFVAFCNIAWQWGCVTVACVMQRGFVFFLLRLRIVLWTQFWHWFALVLHVCVCQSKLGSWEGPMWIMFGWQHVAVATVHLAALCGLFRKCCWQNQALQEVKFTTKMADVVRILSVMNVDQTNCPTRVGCGGIRTQGRRSDDSHNDEWRFWDGHPFALMISMDYWTELFWLPSHMVDEIHVLKRGLMAW